MLNHEWMRQRDRRLRRTAMDGEAGPEPEPERMEVGNVAGTDAAADALDGPEASSAEDRDDSLHDAPALIAPEAEAAPRDTAADAEAEALSESAPPSEKSQDTRGEQRRVAGDLEVAHEGQRERLESVLARQAQLPLDIEARQALTASIGDSPRDTREQLLQRLLDPTLTLRDTATLLDVCPTTVRRYTDRGVLKCFRTPGNQRRFQLSDVLDFMERQSRAQ